MRPTEVIWGLPGTGKTTALLKRLEGALDRGVPLENIVVSTFRTTMAYEFRERAKKKLGDAELPENHMLRNIHAICFRLMGLDTEQVIQHTDRKQVCKKVGVPYEMPKNKSQRDWLNIRHHGDDLGNQLFNIRQYTLNTFMDPVEDWKKLSFLTQEQRDDLSDYLVKEFNKSYEEWKEEKGKVDFDDMLLYCYENNITPGCEVLIEDEFQDKTPLQVELYKQFGEEASRVYIAGDVFQTLYNFMGAQPDLFEKEMDRAKKVIELDKSYRFGPKLWKYATGILKAAGYDYIPEIEPLGDTSVVKVSWEKLSGVLRDVRDEEVFHLTRTNYLAENVAERLIKEGVPFISKKKRWTQKQLDFYNAVIKARRALQNVSGIMYPDFNLKSNEMELLLDSYPAECFDETKKDIREKIDKEDKKTAFTSYINDEFIKSVKAPNPFYKKHVLASAFSDDIFERIQRTWARIKMKELREIGHEVSTIHGAKGREKRVNVIYLGTSNKILRSIDSERKRKEEARVWFTGLTRAKNEAVVVNEMPDTYEHNLGVNI